jgi:hypothetical protein
VVLKTKGPFDEALERPVQMAKAKVPVPLDVNADVDDWVKTIRGRHEPRGWDDT